MKQQTITFAIIFGLLILVILGIAVLASKANNTQQSSPTPSSLLTIPDNKISSIAGIMQRTPSPPPQEGQPTGAVEFEASRSAIATASAKKVKFILTNGKSFTLALHEDIAPKTVANFLSKVKQKTYNDNLFFRVEKDQQGQTMLVQTGDPTNTGQGGGVMTAEYNKKPFTAGSLGVARGQNRDKNNDSQFFITTADVLSLNENYTNFGQVIEGLDVVASIKQGQPILTAQLL